MHIGGKVGKEKKKEKKKVTTSFGWPDARPPAPPARIPRRAAVRARHAPIAARPHLTLTYRRAPAHAHPRASNMYHSRHTLLQKYNNTFRHHVLQCRHNPTTTTTTTNGAHHALPAINPD